MQGNFIGLNALGTMALPNAGNGIIVGGGAQNNVIGAPRDCHRRSDSELQAIALLLVTGGDGVRVNAAATERTIGNTIRGNRIFNSGGLGINLNGGTQDAKGRHAPTIPAMAIAAPITCKIIR